MFVTFRGWSTHAVIETVLGHALRRRGWQPVYVTCGGRLPICDVMPVHAAPPMPCWSCAEYASSAIAAAGFDSVRLADTVDLRAAVAVARRKVAELRSVGECEGFRSDGLPIGRLVRVSVMWFLSRGTLPDTPLVLDTYRRFLISAQVVAEAFGHLLDQEHPQRLVLLNGRFFAEAVMIELAARRGIGYSTYEKGMLPNTLIVSSEGSASDVTMPTRAAETALGRRLSAAQAARLDRYLSERRQGDRSLDRLWAAPANGGAPLRQQLGLESERPIVAMFSNIAWDSAVAARDHCFRSLGDWLVAGIRWAERHPEVYLVVRLHPAEVRVTNHVSLERMADRIAVAAPRLPVNVRVIPAGSRVSSYQLMDEACVGLIYTSTVGLEMALKGRPVVVAGLTHYRGRGFTLDPQTAEEYWEAVDRLISDPPSPVASDRTRDLARRYAYAFLFEFHRPLNAVQEVGHSRPRLNLPQGSLLDPGADANLDLIVADLLGTGGEMNPVQAAR